MHDGFKANYNMFCLYCRYAVAESDCNLSIALDSKYIKAFARRGAARFALKNYQSALEGVWTLSL